MTIAGVLTALFENFELPSFKSSFPASAISRIDIVNNFRASRISSISGVFVFSEETKAARLFSGKHIITDSFIFVVEPEIAVITESGCILRTTSNKISLGTSGSESKIKQLLSM